MKFTTNKEQLVNAVQIVQKAVLAKSNLTPVFSGIFIRTLSNKIELQATNIEISISASIDAVIEEEGTIVLPGKYFTELIRKLPGDSITVHTNSEDHTAKIVSDRSEFSLVTLPPEDFPVFRPLSDKTSFLIKDNVLRDLIKKTVFACAQEDARPIFSGVLLEFAGDEITAAATNTHRLAIKKDKLSLDNTPSSMLIPGKMLKEVVRILPDELPTDIKISYERNQICFSFDDVFLISRLIEGQFPDYRRVIPANFKTRVLVDTKELLSAVNRVSLIAKEGDYNIIRFRFENDEIHISSSNPDIGSAEEWVACKMEGNDILIALNAQYINDILMHINTEMTEISLNQELHPVKINPEGAVDYTYVVTPVRI